MKMGLMIVYFLITTMKHRCLKRYEGCYDSVDGCDVDCLVSNMS